MSTMSDIVDDLIKSEEDNTGWDLPLMVFVEGGDGSLDIIAFAVDGKPGDILLDIAARIEAGESALPFRRPAKSVIVRTEGWAIALKPEDPRLEEYLTGENPGPVSEQPDRKEFKAFIGYGPDGFYARSIFRDGGEDGMQQPSVLEGSLPAAVNALYKAIMKEQP